VDGVDLGAPSSYLELAEGTRVLTSDRTQLGRVKRVLAVEEKDIFDGLASSTASTWRRSTSTAWC
jgi:hypothetical protein